jgi:hypothetical protein
MTPAKKKKKINLVTLVVVIAFFLGLVQLLIANRLAAAGGSVRQLEVKAQQLEEENRLLEEEISRLGSLTAVSERAEALGFEKTTAVVYLTSPVPVAFNPVVNSNR